MVTKQRKQSPWAIEVGKQKSALKEHDLLVFSHFLSLLRLPIYLLNRSRFCAKILNLIRSEYREMTSTKFKSIPIRD